MSVCTTGGRETETSRDYLKPEVLECRSRSQQLWPSHLSEYRYLYVVTKSKGKINIMQLKRYIRRIMWNVVVEITITKNTYIEDCVI